MKLGVYKMTLKVTLRDLKKDRYLSHTETLDWHANAISKYK